MIHPPSMPTDQTQFLNFDQQSHSIHSHFYIRHKYYGTVYVLSMTFIAHLSYEIFHIKYKWWPPQDRPQCRRINGSSNTSSHRRCSDHRHHPHYPVVWRIVMYCTLYCNLWYLKRYNLKTSHTQITPNLCDAFCTKISVLKNVPYFSIHFL